MSAPSGTGVGELAVHEDTRGVRTVTSERVRGAAAFARLCLAGARRSIGTTGTKGSASRSSGTGATYRVTGGLGGGVSAVVVAAAVGVTNPTAVARASAYRSVCIDPNPLSSGA